MQQPTSADENIQRIRPSRRRRPRNGQNYHQQEVVRRNDDSIYSYFSNLFDRPVRRRYLNSINQNATNLVRRLSQSRLFLNTANRSNSHNSHSSQQNSPVTPDLVNPVRSNTISNSNDEVFDIPTAPENADSENISAVGVLIRSETPPPAYKDIV